MSMEGSRAFLSHADQLSRLFLGKCTSPVIARDIEIEIHSGMGFVESS